MGGGRAVGERNEIVDSPVGWVNRHVRRYVESGGAKGHRWQGTDTLLLITRGRRTGKLRRTALIYGRDGDRYVVVGSNGGSAEHPQWFRNLLAEPRVSVQVKDETFNARAVPATGAERSRLWALMAEIFPQYDSYRERTRREIPVVVLEPVAEA
jgi:deazaflavin-dependent oxidoreductase (nitroreductase family)